MNDPNGLVHLDGVYHLFFQHNPLGHDWGNMSWGHATSRDLLHWRELPVAIPCAPDEQIYSGSVVIDRQNSSGLGAPSPAPDAPPLLVAVYTSVDAGGTQAQALAFSHDGGDVWQKYAGNPVLDRGSREFRDPKVFAYTPAGGDGETLWIMVAVEAVDRQVLVYSSPDLRSWVFESAVGPLGPEGVVWECPDLFPLPIDGEPGRETWVMLLSTNRLDEAGDAVDSSMTYLIGDFDGHRFVPDDAEAWPTLDHGRDFYAAVTFHDAPADRRIALAWAGNWQYAARTPTAPWRGAMSLPWELGLTRTADGLVLRRSLPPESRALTAGGADGRDVLLAPGTPVRLDAGRYVVLEVDWDPAPGAGLEIDLLGSIRVRYAKASGELSVERADPSPSVHPGFAAVGRAAVALDDGRLRLLVVVDGCVVEIVAGGGTVVFTDLVFAASGSAAVVVATDGGSGRVTATPIPVAARQEAGA